MSLFSPNIIQDESDLERYRQYEYIRKMMSQMNVASWEINYKSDFAPSHYIVASEQMAKTLKNLW